MSASSSFHRGWQFALLATCVLGIGQARGQFFPTYSVDEQSASVPGLNHPGDILTYVGAGNFPPPAVVIPSNLLGIIPQAVFPSELDALSYGTEPQLQKNNSTHRWTFSVDEFAVGRPGVPGPSVTTEGAFGTQEAAGDIYETYLAPGPMAPFPGVNSGLYDGNGGFTPFAAQGLNLREPTNPTVNSIDSGDNLDAWDIDQPVFTPIAGTAFNVPVYFSMNSKFTDPLDAPYNFGSAQLQGFVGGDVLVTQFAAAAPTVFASATQLGLDKAGPDHDDLDALVLWENGDGAYTPTAGPYSWVGGATDMLLFSVRRGSAIIGTIDPILGLPIEEGDILVPMGSPNSVPGIFVPAEALGLATKRTNTTTFQGFGDELDALDVQQAAVPEPASCVLLLVGICGAWLRRRSR